MLPVIIYILPISIFDLYSPSGLLIFSIHFAGVSSLVGGINFIVLMVGYFIGELFNMISLSIVDY